MRFIHFLVFGVSGLLLSGCLTVSRGTTEKLNVISNPTGANVEAELLLQSGDLDKNNKNKNKELSCNPTPCSVEIPRNNHARVSVSKDGYQPIKFLAVSKGSSPTSTIKPGMIVAGTPQGSHVVAGSPATATRYISGNTLTALQILTGYGTAGTIVDKASGANRSFSPNPVTVNLVPILEEKP
jgi:hypothetical protein